MMKQVRLFAWIGVAVLAAVVAFPLIFKEQGINSLRSGGSADSLAGAPIGGPFMLTDHNGERVASSQFSDKYQLIYFGYTFCPDVCPLELQKLTVALAQVESAGVDTSKIQPIFISVDPDRDTPEVLADYVTLFHPRLIGMTGSHEEIKAVAKEFRIYYAKREDEGTTDYLMDHTSLIFLMGRNGEFLKFFSSKDTVDDIANVLGDLM